MPSVPTGGLSIFVNITILIIGWLYKQYKKTGLNQSLFIGVGRLIAAKKYDTLTRRLFAYSFVFALFTLMVYAIAVSVTARISTNSNYEMALDFWRSLELLKNEIIEALPTITQSF